MNNTTELKCWEIMNCENSDDCPAKEEPQTPCWEIARMRGDFQCAMNICPDCIVYIFMQDVPVFSKQEYLDILKKKGLSARQKTDTDSRKPRRIYYRPKLNVTTHGL